MKCKHPGCNVFLSVEDAVFPPVAEMEKQLKLEYGEVKEHHLAIFCHHAVHGPGIRYSETVAYLNGAYLNPPLALPPTSKTKTPSPVLVAKPPIAVVKDRAFAINVRFGLNPKQLKKVVAKVRVTGIDVEAAMKQVAKNARRYAASKSKPTAQQPST